MTRLQRWSSGGGSIVEPLSHGVGGLLLLLLLEGRRGCCGLQQQQQQISMRTYQYAGIYNYANALADETGRLRLVVFSGMPAMPAMPACQLCMLLQSTSRQALQQYYYAYY